MRFSFILLKRRKRTNQENVAPTSHSILKSQADIVQPSCKARPCARQDLADILSAHCISAMLFGCDGGGNKLLVRSSTIFTIKPFARVTKTIIAECFLIHSANSVVEGDLPAEKLCFSGVILTVRSDLPLKSSKFACKHQTKLSAPFSSLITPESKLPMSHFNAWMREKL